MAIFGIEKTRDFTIMSNYHLRNIKLSLKAKGLFSLMLPFPEGWDYTIMEFTCLCKNGKELEQYG